MKSEGTVNVGALGVLLKRYARFCVVGATGVAVDMGILYWLKINVYLANFIAIVVVSVWNFFMNLRFGWNGAKN